MKIVRLIHELESELKGRRSVSSRLGFVPTMGALHEGHLALIVEAQQSCDYVICSIFVNPKQFNDPNDLIKYPRPIEKDIQMLEQIQCDLLFLPEVETIYPLDYHPIELPLLGLDQTMEGKMRPGHFQGVVEVVYRLLDLVQPDSLFMGQKDLQQFTIVRHLINWFHLQVNLVSVPIVRESDGLALSSRNIRLSPEGRALAPLFYKVLQDISYQITSQPFPHCTNLIQHAVSTLQSLGIEQVEYFEIVQLDNLTSLTEIPKGVDIAICAVVVIDGVRLLDNIIITNSEISV